MRFVLVGVLVGMVGTVAAQPPALTPQAPAPVAAPAAPRERFMVGLGASVGGSNRPSWLFGALFGEVGVTVTHQPVALRVRGFGTLQGGTMESDWGGRYRSYGAGLEARACRRSGACAFLDVDAGYQHLDLDDHTGEFVRSDEGVFAGPRVGFDAGGRVRIRVAFELYRLWSSHRSGFGGRDQDDRSFTTRALSLAVVFQH